MLLKDQVLFHPEVQLLYLLSSVFNSRSNAIKRLSAQLLFAFYTVSLLSAEFRKTQMQNMESGRLNWGIRIQRLS